MDGRQLEGYDFFAPDDDDDNNNDDGDVWCLEYQLSWQWPWYKHVIWSAITWPEVWIPTSVSR